MDTRGHPGEVVKCAEVYFPTRKGNPREILPNALCEERMLSEGAGTHRFQLIVWRKKNIMLGWFSYMSGRVPELGVCDFKGCPLENLFTISSITFTNSISSYITTNLHILKVPRE